MHRLTLLPLFALAILAPGLAQAQPAVACRQKALDTLRAASPQGYAIYAQVKHPDFFASWIDCKDAQLDLSTAVHESTHFIAAETDAFPLIGGGAVPRPHEASAFYPPSRLARQFPADDFAGIYLRPGKASSAGDFLYLLDELNAYAHDLATAVDLKEMRVADESVDHRDGLAAAMAFVAAYAQTARASEPETWRGLHRPAVAHTIRVLWGQAERVMDSSCGIPNFGNADRAYIRRTCAASALGEILGRAPACPTKCLAAPEVEEMREIVEEDPR